MKTWEMIKMISEDSNSRFTNSITTIYFNVEKGCIMEKSDINEEEYIIRWCCLDIDKWELIVPLKRLDKVCWKSI